MPQVRRAPRHPGRCPREAEILGGGLAHHGRYPAWLPCPALDATADRAAGAPQPQELVRAPLRAAGVSQDRRHRAFLTETARDLRRALALLREQRIAER